MQQSERWQDRWTDRLYRKPGWVDGTSEFWKLCAEAIPRGKRLLEVGAGPTNRTSEFLSSLGEHHGVDVDPAVRSNAHLVTAATIVDGRLPYPDASFDACVSDFVLEHVGDPGVHFAEIDRVLTPGGVYVFRTPNRWHYVPLAARLTPHWFHEVISNRVRALPANSHEPYPTYYRANSRHALRAHAARAGLAVRTLRMIEKEPSYGMSSRVLFVVFMLYERVVNSTELLAGLRVNILGVLEKPSRQQ